MPISATRQGSNAIVNIPPHFKAFVEANVRNGRFGNASEVVRAGLLLLEQEETMRGLKIQRLRESAQAGRFTSLQATEVSCHLEKIARSASNKARTAK